MNYPSNIDNDTLRQRIEAARRAKRDACGDALSPEALDAIFASSNEPGPSPRPERHAGRKPEPAAKRCPRCRRPPTVTRFYLYGNGRLSSWCADCQAARSRLRWAERKTAGKGGSP